MNGRSVNAAHAVISAFAAEQSLQARSTEVAVSAILTESRGFIAYVQDL